MLSIFGKHKDYPKVELTVSTRTVAQVLVVVLAFFGAIALIDKASHAITLLVIAFFLALALNRPVHWLENKLPGKKKGNRTLATGISFMAIVLLLTAFVASVVPPLVRQTDDFIGAAPALVDDLRDQNTSLGRFVREHDLEDQVDKVSDQLSTRLSDLSGSLFGTVSRITGSVFAMLAIWVLTFMMLIEGPRWLNLARRFVPKAKRAHADKIAGEMYKVVSGYVNVQVFLAALAAFFIAVPLFLLDVDYPIALVVIVFICGLIPMVGHTIGAIIVSLIALLHSPTAALIILLYYIAYQQIENYFLQPKIQANATKMSPLLVFSSVLIGVSLNGLLGGLLAIPIAGCLRILALDYIERKNLLDEADIPANAYTDKK